MSVITDNRVKFSRHWAMPNSRTYSINCIARLINRYNSPELLSIDPFSNNSRMAKVTNDIDESCNADYHMDAYEFLQTFENNTVDVVLFDPPYSSRQVAECYKKVGRTVNMETTQGSFWTKMKNQIAYITKPNGIVISFGWNTNGIGKNLGFELIEVMMVAHGGVHNDTIITVERKTQTKLF